MPALFFWIKIFRTHFILMLTLVSCTINPVTGEREINFVTTSQEISIGEQQYGPGRQMYGGDYVADPNVTRYVRAVGERLAAVSDRQLPYEFVVINDSTPNAWALPGGKIAVHRGLLIELGSEAELAAVLGHEIVHAAARHSAQAMQKDLLFQSALIAASATANDSAYGSLLMTGAGMSLQFLRQKYGRDAERESDRYGMVYMSRAGYDPRAAVALQETFLRLSENHQADWLQGLLQSHPPSAERVRNNRAMLAELPDGGEIASKKYNHAMTRLRQTRDAYATHDRGRKALTEGDTLTALTAAQLALDIEPNEALFHLLRGDVRAAQSRWGDALTNYERAVNRNPGYFYPLMRRGLAHRQVGDISLAAADLELSIELLPTAPAINALGEIKRDAGDRTTAIELFRAAAQSDSPDGRAAAESLARLELPEKPYRYLKTRLGQDANGRVIIEIANPTRVAVTVSELTLEYQHPDGRVQTFTEPIRGRLGPESVAQQILSVRVDDLRRLRAAVTRAQLINEL
jgi:beta-barrel assembly-enhancing protease